MHALTSAERNALVAVDLTAVDGMALFEWLVLYM